MSVDFFISYTGKDKAWAEWIAWALEDAKYPSFVQAWDIPAGANFGVEMQRGATEAKRTLPVYTPAFFNSDYAKAEWVAALIKDPDGSKKKLVPVRVEKCDPPGLLAGIVFIDLVGLDEQAAREELLRRLRPIVEERRAKPDAQPPFPGATNSKSPGDRPPFPGTKTQREIIHNLPFSMNPFFTGREQLLKDLHDAMHAKTAAAITPPQAVHGLGGVGKTQLAVEYAWANQADYDAILWAGAASAADLHANVATLATVLRLPAAEAREQEARVAAVLDWLRTHRRWLLILDNADTKEARKAVRAFLPTGLPGDVIATSRLANWPPEFKSHQVKMLRPEDGVRYLKNRLRERGCDGGDEAQAADVVKELGGLPLALSQAAAYLIQRHATFAQYLQLLHDSRGRLLQFSADEDDEEARTVATTWLVTEAQLSLRARAVLQLAALLAPDEIPRAMFAQGGKVIGEAMRPVGNQGLARPHPAPLPLGEGTAHGAPVGLANSGSDPARDQDSRTEAHDPKTQAAASNDSRPSPAPTLDPILPLPAGEGRGEGEGASTVLTSDDVDEALAELAGYSLIDLEAEGFTVHRLLQAVLHDRLDSDARRPWLDLAVRLVNDFAPHDADDVRTWPVWNRVQPHATAILREAEGQAHPTAAVLMNELGLLLATKALYAEAEPLYRRALALDEQSFGPEHPTVAIYLNNLAQLLQATNRLAEAEPLMRRALAIDEKSFGPEHPNVARDLNNFATFLQATNRLAEAEPLMRRVLTLAEQSLGPEHPNVATALNNLAQLLQATNRLAEAEPLMRRALAMDERSFGPQHPKVATDLNNLAQLLQATNRLAEAEPLMRRVTAILENPSGEPLPNFAGALGTLAQLLQATHRLAEAEPLMRRALALDELSFGPEHPDVARDLNNLAQLLQATNRLVEAEPLMRRALAIDVRSFGPEHPNVARNLNNLATLLQATNRLAEAEPLMCRALAIDEKSFGPEHPNIARNLNNLATLLQATNRLAEAEPLMRRAVEICERSLGPEHPNTQTARQNYAALQAPLGQ